MAWQKRFLQFAGVYNLLWAAIMIARPDAVTSLLGLSGVGQSLVWQILGFSSGVMGVGYFLASSDVRRHWPIVLMGLLSKIGSGVAMTWSIVDRGGPVNSMWFVAVDDLVWIGPLGMVLYQTYDQILGHRRCVGGDILRMSLRRKTQDGVTLDELSRLSPVLLVFLRHAGCTFCREALADLAKKRPIIERNGTRLVLVHMGSDEQGARFFGRYGLQDVQRISDPERNLYRAFGLPRGSFGDLFGPRVWLRGFQAGILGRHGVGSLVGDGFQMPGVFLLYFGEVVRSYRHQSAADRPDYLQLVTGNEYASPELRS
jgi:peroxiredoxin